MANATTVASAKRWKLEDQTGYDPLIPGLPDHLAQLCLSLVPPALLYSVCRSWRRFIYSSSFPPFLCLYALLSRPTPTTTQSSVNQDQSNSIEFFSFDPISSTWDRLPPPPRDPSLLPLLLRHPSFIARNFPIQSVAVSGNLVLLAATTHHLLPALPRPLVFDPGSNRWRLGPTISTPRRWCATGSAEGAVYVVSGLGSHYNGEVARSAERWDLKNRTRYSYSCWDWEKVAALKHGRFSREAVEAVGWRGKLCMVNVNGSALKEGAVYDVDKDQWEEMPEGMLVGWNGPAASMDEDVLYVVDEMKGVLGRYNPCGDCWEELIESVHLKGAVQIAAGGGRVCAIRAHQSAIAVVDVVARPPRLWVVDPPSALHALAVHILPRTTISRPEPDS
ncbi:PREDICTED: F-box/kelch-repeat protein SKIP25-like [Nelumbo nucifera]|uniref:F-box/kelch-repeat protein SKIP25-like n=2 Tax=Nelumbo nucifera TaxID=4432 RepID=A0A1U8BBV0_NELNU|nr:PREDICTED: F-box/kelch-repeat protein SKIP25-like [Nelumbo nucifera]DAD36437.1 TPA_asm: hypothetical protein HUJ06_007078 [Nelumbo nucifera]